MTTIQENAKKTTKKSRLSSAYKSQTSKKSLNHKEKIVNAIKKSTLKTFQQFKLRKSAKSRNSISNTDKKKKPNPYQIHSQRNKSSQPLNSISKTVPIKYSKQKHLQFPFQAIKFKQRVPQEQSNHQNKTHDQFYIRYDQPQMTEMDLSVLQNSKKIIGAHNQRIGRYSELKAKNKYEYNIGIKNIEFKQCLIKLFRFLDPHNTHVISHTEIDYRKVPQAVLYFLGGLFQRIRQKNLYLSQIQFLQQCQQIYLRSSNQDVKWFIEQVQTLSLQAQQRPKQVPQIMIKSTQTEIAQNNFTQQLRIEQKIQFLRQKDKKIQQDIKILQDNKISQDYKIPQNYRVPKDYKILRDNSISFEQQNSVVSFRKQNKDHIENYNSKQSRPSERQSYQSAQFGYQGDYRFSFNAGERPILELQNQKVKLNSNSKRQSLTKKQKQNNSLQMQLTSQTQALRSIGIKKNIQEKVQDMRQQIYAKLDKLKIIPQNKQNNILRDNFKITSLKDNLPQNRQISKQNIKSTISKNYNYFDSIQKQNKQFKQQNNTNQIIYKQKAPLLDKKQSNMILPQMKSTKYQDKIKQQIKQLRESNKINKQFKQLKEYGWVNKVKNCQTAFQQLQRIRDQFNKHKNTIQQKQTQRQNYFKGQSKKQTISNNKYQDFIHQQQTRVLKLDSKKQIIQQKRIFAQQRKAFDQQIINNKQNSVYQKNIDRLSNLSNSRNQSQNILPINLHQTLSNSCRKSVQITLPLRNDTMKGMSLSDKKPISSLKIDKIDQLSHKLEQYLAKNAQKIQYSKHFTESTGTHKFNRLLAL